MARFSAKLADGSNWPIDVEAISAIAHRLRYDLRDYNAASVLDAYLYLITVSTRIQRSKLQLIRKAWEATPITGGGVEGGHE